MIYKGFTGILEIDEEDDLLHGHVIGLRDEILFQGATLAEARKSFEETVDFYLKRCEETGKKPDRPFAGQFLIRVDAETHRGLDILASAHKLTMNDVIAKALSDFVAANRLWANDEMIASWTPKVDERRPKKARDRAAVEKGRSMGAGAKKSDKAAAG